LADPPQSLPPPPPLDTLAEKLDYLFRTAHPPGRGEYTYREAAAGIRARGGPPTLSAAYLWQLRTGQSADPRMSYLEAIARFFDVPVGFFFDRDASGQIGTDVELLSAIRDPDTRELVLRARELSTEAKAGLLGLVDLLRRLEGVPRQPQRRRGRRPSGSKPRGQTGGSQSADDGGTPPRNRPGRGRRARQER
jgi:transcriptional regulator with XRE-family HTH domain